jgi:glutathione S-transferase
MPTSQAPVEIHGYLTCPFAWRVRLAAAEKAVAADFLPADVDTPDPRVAQHNPHEHSPLLFHDGLILRESSIIIEYLEEAFSGPALLPREPRVRAELRLLAVELKDLDVQHERARPEARKKSEGPLGLLEAALGRHAPFLHGATPGLADVMIWPFLADLSLRKLLDPQRYPAAEAYLDRARARASFHSTRAPWAATL